METRLRIDLQQGSVHVSGTEEFVREIYRDFKAGSFATHSKPPAARGETSTSRAGREARKGGTKSPRVGPRRPGPESHSLVRDLDLAGGDRYESLHDFLSRYGPQTNYEFNLLVVYYLQRLAGIAPITAGHVFTCYRHAGRKVPASLNQNLYDTTRRKGWLNTSSLDDVSVTVSGENAVLHDLSRE